MTYQEILSTLENVVPELTDQTLPQLFNHTTSQRKTDGSIVTEADMAMQEVLQQALKSIAPEVVMLSEEMDSQQQQAVIHSGLPYWCLDPVDGTNNFHHGVPLYAVSLALIDQQQIRLGIIYDPDRKEVFSAYQGSGLRINGLAATSRLQPEKLKGCLASVDFKRLSNPLKERLIEKMPFKSQRNIGTCALEWAWLAAGRTQLLLHGGEKFWDYAAGCLLLEESGGVSCTDSGEPVFNNSLDSRPIVAASHHSLHRQWLAYLTN